MNVEELFALCGWVQQQVVDRRIPDQFTSLTNVLRVNTQPNQPKRPFENEKNTLIASLNNVPLNVLTNEQTAFLAKVGLASHLGEAGAAQVEDILVKNAIDVATAANKVQEIQSRVNSAVTKFQQIQGGLGGLVQVETPEMNSEVLLRVKFSGDAQIANVVDLKDWSEKWHAIARGIAMSHNQAPETIRVVGAGRGSIVLELAVTTLFATSVSSIMLSALKVSERFVVVLQEVEKLKAMRFSNEILKAMKEEAAKERDDGVAEISKKVIKEAGLKAEKHDGEKIGALGSAIKTLVHFVTDGGEVDCVVPDSTPNESGDAEEVKARGALAKAFQEIRKLEQESRRIEHRPSGDA